MKELTLPSVCMLANCMLTLNSASPCCHTTKTEKKNYLQVSVAKLCRSFGAQIAPYVHVHNLFCVSEHCANSETNLSHYQPRISALAPILNKHPYSYVYVKKLWMYNVPYSLHSEQGRRHRTQGLHGDSRLQCNHILQPSDWTRSRYQRCLSDRKLGNSVLLTRQDSY